MRKFLIITTVVLVALVGGAWALRAAGKLTLNFAGPGDAGGEGTPVRVEPARRGDLTEIVAAPGTVVPETKVSISARVSAKIIELPHDVGDRVTRGDGATSQPSVLVRLDSTDIDANLRAAQARHGGQLADIDTAKARIEARSAQTKSLAVQLENRQTELERQEALLASNDVSKQIVDDLRATVAQVKAQIEGEQGSIQADRVALEAMKFASAAALAEVDRIRDSQTYTTITSPIDGLVTVVNAEVGEIAVTGTMNNAGTVILEVADLNTMLVEARVDETDIADVKVGQPAVVRMEAYPNQTFAGTVQTVALSRTTDADDRSQYYEVKVLIERRGQSIVSGLTADVEIQTRKHAGVVRVPSQAVLGRPVDGLPAGVRERPEVDANRTTAIVVYRLIDGKAVVTPVRLGASDLTHTVIDSGLAEGDLVIVGPYKVLESIQHDEAFKDERAATRPSSQTQAAPQATTAATTPAQQSN